MAIYEFVCTNCNERYEIITNLGDEPPKVCIKCGGTLKKVFHPVGIVFKGSGFYTTDYKKKSSEEKDSSKDKNDNK
ncbi:MAG: FmdB family transcriptional regulator [Dictyoglomus sp. NZ13-RE01]|nr:MAG: FmdB family transcriptional regulator [Dictyoglomus sp. NZ13-RE01]